MPNKASRLEIQVDAETGRAIRDLEELTSGVAAIGEAAAESTAGLAEMNAEASAAAEDTMGALSSIVPVIDVTAILEQFGALAGAVGEFFSGELTKAMDFDAGRDALQVQLGLTVQDAKELGQLAGDVYSEAWGDSLDDVNEAIKLVIKNIGLTADSANLKPITTQVLALADAFEVDLGGATQAVGVLMKTGLSDNAEDALDLVFAGLQKASGEADDFLDTLSQSSANLKTFGLTGKQAVGLIVQGLQAGAENADAITGLFQELVGNVASGGDELSEVFKSLGLDSDALIKKLGEGGPAAAEGLDELLDAIRTIEDPLKRSAAIAALFGEEGAALQQVLLNLDPSNAVQALGDVAGAAESATASLGENAKGKFEAFRRSLETNVTIFIADNVIPALTSLGDKAVVEFGKMGAAWDLFVKNFKGGGPVKLGVENGQLTSSISAIEQMNAGNEFAEGSVQRLIQDLALSLRELTDTWLPRFQDALEDTNKKLQELAEFFRENKDLAVLLSDVIKTSLVVALGFLAGAIFLVSAGIGALIGFMALMLAPIFTLIFWINRLGINWEGVWEGMKSAARGGAHVIGGLLEDIGRLLSTFVDNVWPDDWARFWDNIVGIVRRAKDSIFDFVGAIRREIQNFLDLLKRVSNPFSGLGIGGNAVGPTAMMVGPQAVAGPALAGAVGRPTTVINVTISHAGLGIDSPRLQRDLVGALERYDRREGPRR